MTRKILNEPIFQDDYGFGVYVCQYTKKLVVISHGEFIYLGACLPQVKGSYVCSVDSNNAYKESKTLFNEFEANCNTCKNLTRVPFKKQHPANPMTAICSFKKENITFHPDDHMGMECWEKR
jgi:hypothetical protein